MTTWAIDSLNALSLASVCASATAAPPVSESNAGDIFPTVMMTSPLNSLAVIGTGRPCALANRWFRVARSAGASAPASQSNASRGAGSPPSVPIAPTYRAEGCFHIGLAIARMMGRILAASGSSLAIRSITLGRKSLTSCAKSEASSTAFRCEVSYPGPIESAPRHPA